MSKFRRPRIQGPEGVLLAGEREATVLVENVVVPVVVVAVDVHVALVVPPVERGESYRMSPLPLAHRMLSELYRIRDMNHLAFCTKYLRF